MNVSVLNKFNKMKRITNTKNNSRKGQKLKRSCVSESTCMKITETGLAGQNCTLLAIGIT